MVGKARGQVGWKKDRVGGRSWMSIRQKGIGTREGKGEGFKRGGSYRHSGL